MSPDPRDFFNYFCGLALFFVFLVWTQGSFALDISMRTKEAREMKELIDKYENCGVYEGDVDEGSGGEPVERAESSTQQRVEADTDVDPNDPFEFLEYENGWDLDIVSQSADDTEDEIKNDVENTEQAAERAAFELSGWSR